ncbi:unnamed protein product [Vitrella brassicaformis CCMP3155]|uniref:Uncharacterized protein n=2 Tax=Vitrella brassicaformis TaxID=1169539 RepID=A0A0G4H8F1_VITBC|nr:unnamed protein product [Vitrella brassicaformis CCMP3155]|eukprot:CEM40145.1 unnamed protein product [Vitrella brassicaformis CCMP3155]
MPAEEMGSGNKTARPGAPPLLKSYRWPWYELLLYGSVIAAAFPYVCWIGYSYSNKLELWQLDDLGILPGWIGQRHIDMYDFQWEGIRNALPILTLGAMAHVGGSRLLRVYLASTREEGGDDGGAERDAPLLAYHLLFGMVYVCYLHGCGTFWLLSLVLVNFCISRLCAAGHSLGPALTWLFNVTILLTNDYFAGYRFEWIHPRLGALDQEPFIGVSRWHVHFPMVTLKLISFNMDLYWAVTRRKSPLHGRDEFLSYRYRQETHQPMAAYSTLAYLSYVLYPPLYLAGPTASFNAWRSHMHVNTPQVAYSPMQIGLYGLRWLGNLLCFEVFLHFNYANAIASSVYDWFWRRLSVAELGLCAFWTLFFIWMKFLLIWRYFLLWALCDGVECPENMNRCVYNNYSTEQFWRSWHRAFNQWLLRYIYFPLGGSAYKLVNVWVVFLYVAVWHDVRWRLLSWAALVCVIIAPEILVRMLAATKPIAPMQTNNWFRYVIAVGGSFNVFLLIAANLVGFSFGLEGLKLFISRLFGSREGVWFMWGSFVTVFSGVNLQLWIRSRQHTNY